MPDLTIIIPSRNERFLNETIRDVVSNSGDNTEIIPILDGYDTEHIEHPRVRYIQLPKVRHTQKRHGINKAVAESKSKYVMSLDAHCMVAKGFDEQLIKDHQDNWIQIPRRHRLDPINWCLQTQSDNRPPIDYEYFMFQGLTKDLGLHGFKWDERTLERWNIPIDDTMEFQGSCWFMTRDWFNENKFMQIEGYTGWGQEAEELGLTTWQRGGRVVTNKNTWYAHLHKGPTFGRMYYMSRKDLRKCYEYSYNHWIVENKEFFISHIEKFWPVPKWPGNWKTLLWK